jgi:hypothetical protein
MNKKCFLCKKRIDGWAYTDLDTNLTFCGDCFHDKREEAEECICEAKENKEAE